jgi:hypothetical protein
MWREILASKAQKRTVEAEDDSEDQDVRASSDDGSQGDDHGNEQRVQRRQTQWDGTTRRNEPVINRERRDDSMKTKSKHSDKKTSRDTDIRKSSTQSRRKN